MNARLGSAASPALDALDPRGYAIVDGAIGHRRRRPVVNAFRYPAFCLRLPLSRLAELPSRGIALDRRGAIAFHERDHGPRDGSPLLPWIRARLAREGVDADGEVVLHAFPRMLGYVFNPVSFWVAYDRRGAVRAVLAQVNNTFGEQHEYLVAHADRRPIRDGEPLEARKVFHVSPFCDVRGRYAFRFAFGGARWRASTTSTATGRRHSSRPGSPAAPRRWSRRRSAGSCGDTGGSRSASSPASTGRRSSSGASVFRGSPNPRRPVRR
jgi:DUF1365 family protein